MDLIYLISAAFILVIFLGIFWYFDKKREARLNNLDKQKSLKNQIGGGQGEE